MKILIVDDEAPARQRLSALLAEVDGAEVVGEAADGRSALALAERLGPDVLLLDIRMPVMDGLETARHLARLARPPAVIFTTAYSDYALDAFEAQAVDYLVKPVRRERLERALAGTHRLTRAQLAALESARGPRARTHISARVKGDIRLVPVDEVLYLQADHKYVTVGWPGGEVLIDESLKMLEQEFGERFLRVHRNALVAADRVWKLEKDAAGRCRVHLRGTERTFPVSRRHLPGVRRRLRAGR